MIVYKASEMRPHWFTFDDTHKCLNKSCNVHTHKVIALTRGNVVFAFRLCGQCWLKHDILIMVDKTSWSARFYERERR